MTPAAATHFRIQRMSLLGPCTAHRKEGQEFPGKRVDATLPRAPVVDARNCDFYSSLYLGRIRPIIIATFERSVRPSTEGFQRCRRRLCSELNVGFDSECAKHIKLI